MAEKNGEVLMTEGSIWKHIVKFALPLALGYLFQQLYTTVDSVVVGNYVFCAVNIVVSGALCGAGETRLPTAIKFFSFVIFRQIYLYFISKTFDSLFWVVMGYPIGWILSAVFITIYYLAKRNEITGKFYA